MNKIDLGLLLGGILGILDGLTAFFTPEVRSEMVGIVIGSTIKGLNYRCGDRFLCTEGQFPSSWNPFRSSGRNVFGFSCRSHAG